VRIVDAHVVDITSGARDVRIELEYGRDAIVGEVDANDFGSAGHWIAAKRRRAAIDDPKVAAFRIEVQGVDVDKRAAGWKTLVPRVPAFVRIRNGSTARIEAGEWRAAARPARAGYKYVPPLDRNGIPNHRAALGNDLEDRRAGSDFVAHAEMRSTPATSDIRPSLRTP
jgi:hypothetical protein